MPNPNVLAGYLDEVNYWKSQLRSGIHSKKTKEYILTRLRQEALKAGVHVPTYNSTAFSEWLAKDEA